MTGHPDWLAAHRIFHATNLVNDTRQYANNEVVTFTIPPSILSDNLAGHISTSSLLYWRMDVKTPAGDIAFRRSGFTELLGTAGVSIRPLGGDVDLVVANTIGAFQPTATSRVWDYIGPTPADLTPQMSVNNRTGTLAGGSIIRVTPDEGPQWHEISWSAFCSQTYIVEFRQSAPNGDPGVGSYVLLDTIATGAANQVLTGTVEQAAYAPGIQVRNTSASVGDFSLSAVARTFS